MIKITFPDGAVREYQAGVTTLKLQKASVSLWRKRRLLVSSMVN